MTWKDIPGRAAYLWIYDDWIKRQPREGAVVVECGVALGKSIAYLCERLDAAGRDDVQVFAVDPWAGTHRNGEQQQWAEAQGGDFTLYTQWMLRCAPRAFERVQVLRVTSFQAAEILTTPDLVVLDNDHSYEHVREELAVFRDLGAKWIGGDDHCDEYPGVGRAVREAFGEDYEYRAKGGPWDDPECWEWGTWLHRETGE